MKTSRLGLFGIIAITLAGCAHRQKVADTELKGLKFPHMCLGRALHASMTLSSSTAALNEEQKKTYFKNYFEAYLDAKEQEKYIACLEEDRGAKDYRKDHDQAKQWLSLSQTEAKKYMPFFPPEKQITDVQETFTDINDKRTNRHVMVTLQDGTQTVTDEQFDKASH